MLFNYHVIEVIVCCLIILLAVCGCCAHSEETNDLSKHASEIARNVQIEDSEPVQTVNNPSSEVTESSVKPKYRFVELSSFSSAVGRETS